MRPLEIGALALLSVVWLSVAFQDLNLPGFSYDEAYVPLHAVEALQGLPVRSPWTLKLFGTEWPLLSDHPYDMNGADIYLSALAFRLGGIGVVPLRVVGLLFTWGTILLFYGFCRLWFPRRVAWMALGLAAVSPVLLLWGRIAFLFHVFFILFFAHAGLLLVSCWYKFRSEAAFLLGVFLWMFSVNFSTKALGVLVAFPAVYFAVTPRARWPSRRLLVLGALCALAAGLSPLLYNVLNGFPTLRVLVGGPSGANSLVDHAVSALPNLFRRLDQMRGVLQGVHPAESVSGTELPNRLAPWLFGGAFLYLLGSSLRGGMGRDRAVLAVLLLPAAMFVLTVFVPVNLNPLHLSIVWPFPCLIAALFLDRVFRMKARSALPRLASVLLFAATVFFDARVVRGYFQDLRYTGGTDYYTDAIYGLARYLERRGVSEPASLTWGVAMNVGVLTEGQVRPLDAHSYGYGPNPVLESRYEVLARTPGTVFIEVARDLPSHGRRFGYYEAFDRVLFRLGKTKDVEAVIPDRRGRGTFVVYKLRNAKPRA